ncbi:hypothetical protein CHS0354_040543 [Potamilus streckersoni]|uniref:Protein kinase domain-containing protein n=1 Tax=Potamilus streckersoni TaxID=2493646 RepID=A0AAE0W5P8_9BIVA|nr:hypothetical protein CHS0354_040543 [Potamilus streckersoni]
MPFLYPASNILLDGDMNARLCDIGFSATLETHRFANKGCTTILGSCFWASPEVAKGEQSNAKVDIWSLGCTIIQLLTAHRPWYPHPPYTALLRIGCNLSPLSDAHEQFSISDVMKEFLYPIFHVDASKRPSAQDLLLHSVFS